MTDRTQWGPAPTLDDIAAMARAALDSLDEPFLTHAKSVAIKVEDFADEETLEAMKIDNAYDLTGLYSGVALTLELHSSPSQIPPMVWLYRMPILDEWAGTPTSRSRNSSPTSSSTNSATISAGRTRKWTARWARSERAPDADTQAAIFRRRSSGSPASPTRRRSASRGRSGLRRRSRALADGSRFSSTV